MAAALPLQTPPEATGRSHRRPQLPFTPCLPHPPPGGGPARPPLAPPPASPPLLPPAGPSRGEEGPHSGPPPVGR
eukprot:12938202-Prorocentrum_lima.AAC.1